MSDSKDEWTDEETITIRKLADEFYNDFHSTIMVQHKMNRNVTQFIFDQAIANALIRISAALMFSITDGSDKVKDEFVELFGRAFLEEQQKEKERKIIAERLREHLESQKSQIEEAMNNCESHEEAIAMLKEKTKWLIKTLKDSFE
jgi:predicted nuclease with TOPRIM domain